MEISLRFSDSVKKFIFEKGYDKKFGARPLRRAIQTHLEDGLAEAILRGEVKKGDTVNVSIHKIKGAQVDADKKEQVTFTVKKK